MRASRGTPTSLTSIKGWYLYSISLPSCTISLRLNLCSDWMHSASSVPPEMQLMLYKQLLAGWRYVKVRWLVSCLIAETRLRRRPHSTSPMTAPVSYPHTLRSSAYPPPISITQLWRWPPKRRSCGIYTNHRLNLSYESYVDYRFRGTLPLHLRHVPSKSGWLRGNPATGSSQLVPTSWRWIY